MWGLSPFGDCLPHRTCGTFSRMSNVVNFSFEPNSCDQVIGVAATGSDLGFKSTRHVWGFRQVDHVSSVDSLQSFDHVIGGQVGKRQTFDRTIAVRAQLDFPAIKFELRRRNFRSAAKAAVEITTSILNGAVAPMLGTAGNPTSAAERASHTSTLRAIIGPAAIPSVTARTQRPAFSGLRQQGASGRRDTPCNAWPSVPAKFSYLLSGDTISLTLASASLSGKALQ